MRSSLFRVLGILEILSAGVLYSFVWQLPGPDDVRDKVGRIERVSRQTGAQVRQLRDDVRHIRQSQPHAHYLAEEMRTQLRLLGDNLKNQQIDYATLTTLYDSFGTMAKGLDGMSDHLAPDGFAQLAEAMRLMADYLDKQLCPAADQVAAHLEEELPKTGAKLARLLRDTGKLREVAKVLRTGQAGIEKTVGRWPELRKNLGGSAELLRATQQQFKHVLDNRQVYEASLKQSRSMIEGLSAALPMYTDQWGRDVAEQERSLSKLGTSIDDVSAVMPEIKTTGVRLLVMTRLLLSLVAAIFLLHGGYLAIRIPAEVRMQKSE